MIPVNHLCVLGRLSWFPLACPSKTGLRAGLPGLGRRSHPHSDIVSIPIIHNVVRHLQALQPQCIGLPKQGVLWGSSQLPASCPYMCKWPRVLGAGVAGRPWPFCPCGTGSTHLNKCRRSSWLRFHCNFDLQAFKIPTSKWSCLGI